MRGMVFKMAHYLISRLSNPRLPMYATDYKLFSRRVAAEILQIGEYDPFVRGLSFWVGFPQAFVPYNAQARRHGNTKSSLRGLKPYKELIRGITSFSIVPLYLSLLLGIGVAMIAVLAAIGLTFAVLFGVITSIGGYASIMVTILFLGGLILFSLGIVGIYLGKVYESAKGRPRYIVSEFIEQKDNNEVAQLE